MTAWRSSGGTVSTDLMLDTPDTRAAGQALLEDEAKFIDFSKSPLWFGEEKVIFG
jgi:hypothetical protein